MVISADFSDYLDSHEVSEAFFDRVEGLHFVVVFDEEGLALDGGSMSLSEDLLNLLQESVDWVSDLRRNHQVYLFK